MAHVRQCTGGDDCALTYCARMLSWAAEWQIREYLRGGVRMHPALQALHELHQTIHLAVCPRTRSLFDGQNAPVLIARCYTLAQGFPEPARSRLGFLIWLELGRSTPRLPSAQWPRAVVSSTPSLLHHPSSW